MVEVVTTSHIGVKSFSSNELAIRQRPSQAGLLRYSIEQGDRVPVPDFTVMLSQCRLVHRHRNQCARKRLV